MRENIENEINEVEESKPKKAPVKKQKPAKDEAMQDSTLNPRYQNKMPLVVYIISIVVAVVFGILLAVDNGARDLALSQGLYNWAHLPENESLLNFFTGWSALVGGQLVYLIAFGACLVIWILSFGNSKKAWENQRVRPILKYAGVIVLSALIALVVNFLFKGALARVPPNWAEGNPDFTIWCVAGTQPNPWTTSSFPSFAVSFAAVLLSVTYWFNTKKSFPLKIVFTALVLVYVIIMGLAVVATGEAFLSDAILSAVITYWITALVGKGILAVKEQELFDVYMRIRLPFNLAYYKIVQAKEALDYEAIPKYMKKAYEEYKLVYEAELARVEKENKKLNDEYEKAKAKAASSGGAEPEKPVEIVPNENIVRQYELFEEGSKLGVNDLEAIKGIVDKITDENYLITEIHAILEDNKAVAIDLLVNSIAGFKNVIEKAKLEIMDFSVLIRKSEIMIGYATRFLDELKELEETKGTIFDEYMMRNFLYVL